MTCPPDGARPSPPSSLKWPRSRAATPPPPPLAIAPLLALAPARAKTTAKPDPHDQPQPDGDGHAPSPAPCQTALPAPACRRPGPSLASASTTAGAACLVGAGSLTVSATDSGILTLEFGRPALSVSDVLAAALTSVSGLTRSLAGPGAGRYVGPDGSPGATTPRTSASGRANSLPPLSAGSGRATAPRRRSATASARQAARRAGLRIARTGNSFSLYYSTNGTTWNLTFTQTVVFNGPVEVGVGYAGQGNPGQGVFDNFSIASGGCVIATATGTPSFSASPSFTPTPPYSPTPSPSTTGTASATPTASPSNSPSPLTTPTPTPYYCTPAIGALTEQSVFGVANRVVFASFLWLRRRPSTISRPSSTQAPP